MRHTVPIKRVWRTKSRGLSLVELMIALVLGLLVVGGVLSIFLGTRQAIRTSENLSRMQENSRFAFETLARELRVAGSNHCGATRVTNVINNAAATWWANWEGGAVLGYAGGTVSPHKPFGAAVADRVNGTDAIVLISGSLGTDYPVRVHAAAGAPPSFTIGVTSDIQAGDALVACDQQSAAIFHASTRTAIAGGIEIGYDVGAGNCITELGFPGACPPAASTPKTFAADAILARLSSSFWYVGNNERGTRSLYRMAINGNPVPRTDEIAEGVQNLSITYLTRNGNVLAPDYIAANAIPNWNDAANQVVAVRIEADLQSADAIGTNNQRVERKFYAVVSLRGKETAE